MGTIMGSAKGSGNGVQASGKATQASGTSEGESEPNLFALELKAWRLKRGWTQVELGAKIGYSDSYISDIENSDKLPHSDFAKKCDEAFDAPGTLERLLEVAKTTVFPDYFAPVIPHERQSARISGWENANIPGLLQTEEYARELTRVTRHDADEAEIERLVSGRLDRQGILTGEKPPKLWYVMDESPLRRVVGNPGVMTRQIERLIDSATTPRFTIQVVTFDKGGGIGASGPITIYEQRDGQPMVCYLEAHLGGRLIEEQREVQERMDDLNLIRASALSPRETITFLQKLRGEYHGRTMAQE